MLEKFHKADYENSRNTKQKTENLRADKNNIEFETRSLDS